MKLSPYSYLLMLSHTCSDLNQGALPALLPFLILHNNLSYTSAAGLMFAANFVSSIVQPFFGYLGDKASHPWFMALGIFMAGSGLAVVGFLENYWTIFFAVMLSGLGIAIFHPEGGRLANLVAGENKGKAISIFAVGGNMGFAIGPLVVSFALLTWGPQGSSILFFPAAAMALVILFHQKALSGFSKKDAIKKQNALINESDDWQGFSKVALILCCRSVIFYGLMTFIPLYWINVLQQSAASGSAKLTIFSLASAAATLVGGHIADRYGYTRIIRSGFIVILPVLLLLINTGNIILATILVIPLAFSINLPLSSLIIVGQSFLPSRLGFASGIMLGLAVSIGGMSTPGIGWIGDNYGLSTAMYAIAVVVAVSIFLTFVLSEPRALAKAKT